MLTIFELCESKPKINNEIHHQCVLYSVVWIFLLETSLLFPRRDRYTIRFSFLEKMFFSCLKINDY